MTQARRSGPEMLKRPTDRDGDICAPRAAGVPAGPEIGLTPIGAAVRSPDSSAIAAKSPVGMSGQQRGEGAGSLQNP